MNVPYGRQYIDEDDIQAVVDVLRSPLITTGPVAEQFEKAVADYTDSKYAVAVSNGTAALHIACQALDIKPGDEVITSPMTFAASANCALFMGAKPVFADIKSDTYNIDPAEIEKCITSKTKAIIPVHYTGQPCEMDEIHDVARRHGIPVIEDGAQVLSAKYKGKPVGGLSEMTTLSFHPVKPITTGEGGMVLTNDEDLYKRLKLFRSHAITRDSSLWENEGDGPWYYEQLGLSTNYRITDIQCALGISQLKKLDGFAKTRKEMAERYNEAFKDNKNIVIPYQHPDCESSWHLYMIEVPKEIRKEAFIKLYESGVGVNVHYIPVYHHPYYRHNGYKNTYCKNAEEFYARAITLPLFGSMTENECDFVIENVNRIVDELTR